MYLKVIHIVFRILIISILSFLCTSAFTQSWRSGWVYIENVKTGLVMDVQGDVKANGTNVWPYSINYGRAQMFRFSEYFIPERFGSDARYIEAYDNSGSITDFYLSVKTPPQVIVATDPNLPSSPGIIRPELVLPLGVFDSGHPPSNKKTLRNYVFTIEEKRELDNSPISLVNDHALTSGSTPKQIWKILPVPNEPNVYYIQNAHFAEKMVIEPMDFSSGGTLVLSSFTGSDLQKWKILKTKPNEPTDLKLTNFKWEEIYSQEPFYKPWKWHYIQSIKGKLTWTNRDVSSLSKQRIVVDGRNSDYETITLEPNVSSYEFNLKSSSAAKTKEHCFNVITYTKWQAENWAFSDEVCEKPDYLDSPSTPPVPSTGVGKLIIYNCHNDKKSVRLWTYNLTNNTGVWKDHGTLGSQWQGSGCPSGSPKEIDINDSNEYLLVAIDCGDLPPNQTQATCHKLTSSQIQGGCKWDIAHFSGKLIRLHHNPRIS